MIIEQVSEKKDREGMDRHQPLSSYQIRIAIAFWY